jgi:indole-3-glycerol phosphate synthase
LLKKIQIFKALDTEIKKHKGPSTVKHPYRDHKSLKEVLGQSGVSVIAEISGGNPMRGRVRNAFRPSTHAKSLLESGAKALSVATDRFLYAGTDKHLTEVRGVAKCPLIRRDFIFEEYQVEESKILGADAIFLTAALLEANRIKALQSLAIAKNLDVVVEVADESDLERALEAEAQIICVVGRDLDTWEGRWEKISRLVKKIPQKKCLKMVEAGISRLQQVKEIEAMGVHGVIIGDALLDEFYPGKRLAQLLAGIEPPKKSSNKIPKTPKAATVTETAKGKSSKSQSSSPSHRPSKGIKETSMVETETVKKAVPEPEKKPAAPKKAAAKQPAAKAVSNPAAKAVSKPAAKKAAPKGKAVSKTAKPTAKKTVKPAAKKTVASKKAAPKKKVTAKTTKRGAKKAAKPAVKKAVAPKKAAPKKVTAKKAAPKKAAPKKVAPKKVTAKKVAPKTAAPKKKVTAKTTKPVAKKTTKPAVKKAVAPKKAAPKAKPAKAVVKKAVASKKPAPKKAAPARKK